jgi:hypothetical protein
MAGLKIVDIKLDPELQPRVELNAEVIKEYANAMQEGEIFPTVTVFFDGEIYWLADGFHRVRAAEAAGLNEIEADIRHGSKKDALLFSLAANSKHGLRRTQADKRKAVMTLLADLEYRAKSDREIGRLSNVDHKTVAAYRRELEGGEFPIVPLNPPEVLDFFPKNGVWLHKRLLETYKEIGYYPDIWESTVLPEVQRVVSILKEKGIERITGPLTLFCDFTEDVKIIVATRDGRNWWAGVLKNMLQGDREKEEGYGNTHRLPFDLLISFLLKNEGTDYMISNAPDILVVEKDIWPECKFWSNLILGDEMPKSALAP